MTRSKIVLAGSVFLVLIVTGVVLVFTYRSVRAPGGAVACTMEALLCPDGSGVGREGPSCTFAACPNQDSFTGTFVSDAQGTRLISASPIEALPPNYAMPLVLAASTTISSGSIVTVSGTFTHGNILDVTSITKLDQDPHQATLRVGEAKLIQGVKVTLLRIEEDSRCPSNVVCVWAGRVRAEVTLQSDTDRESVTLGSDAPHAFDAYTISLITVLPAKSKTTISASDYQLTFEVDPLVP